MMKYIFIWDDGTIHHVIAFTLEDAFDALPLEDVLFARKFQAVVLKHRCNADDKLNQNCVVSRGVKEYGQNLLW